MIFVSFQCDSFHIFHYHDINLLCLLTCLACKCQWILNIAIYNICLFLILLSLFLSLSWFKSTLFSTYLARKCHFILATIVYDICLLSIWLSSSLSLSWYKSTLFFTCLACKCLLILATIVYDICFTFNTTLFISATIMI